MILQLKIPNMACAACANKITEAVQNIDPSANIDADTQTKLVKIKTVMSESTIRDTIAKAGYPPA